MPQAALPDLNQAVAMHRSTMARAVGWRDSAAVLRSVQILNGCLDPKFKLSFIPWAEFKTKTKTARAAVCPHCQGTHPVKGVQVAVSKWPRAMRQVLGEANAYRYIVCPKKKKWIYLDDPGTDFVHQPANIYHPDLEAPLPPPHETLDERVRWSRDYDEWAAIITSILEDRCRLFRASYSTGRDPDSTDDEEE